MVVLVATELQHVELPSAVRGGDRTRAQPRGERLVAAAECGELLGDRLEHAPFEVRPDQYRPCVADRFTKGPRELLIRPDRIEVQVFAMAERRAGRLERVATPLERDLPIGP